MWLSNIQCSTSSAHSSLGPVTRKHFGDIMKPTAFFEEGQGHARDVPFVQILLVSTLQQIIVTLSCIFHRFLIVHILLLWHSSVYKSTLFSSPMLRTLLTMMMPTL